MSTIYNFGGTVNYHDNSKNYHIDANGRDLTSIIKACDTEDVEPVKEDKASGTSSIPPDFFRITERFTEENIRERLAAELSQATTKKDYCRGLYRLQHIGCINIDQYASDAQRADVFNRFQSKYDLSASDFCKARMN